MWNNIRKMYLQNTCKKKTTLDLEKRDLANVTDQGHFRLASTVVWTTSSDSIPNIVSEYLVFVVRVVVCKRLIDHSSRLTS